MDERVATCLLISKVLVADGMMAAPEKAFLGRVMAGLELDEAERRRVLDLDGLDEADDVVAALPADRRQQIVDQLVEAALVDGKLSPHEMDVVQQLSRKLGVGD